MYIFKMAEHLFLDCYIILWFGAICPLSAFSFHVFTDFSYMFVVSNALVFSCWIRFSAVISRDRLCFRIPPTIHLLNPLHCEDFTSNEAMTDTFYCPGEEKLSNK